MTVERKYKIVLFDGVCNLCNNTVTTIIKRDKQDKFRFSALQSDAGYELVNAHKIDTSKVDSIILLDGDKYYVRSTAALKIARELSGLYPLFYIFMIVPNFIRNWVYDIIARNRYRWYGKKDSCMVPTPELKKKFL